MNGSGQEVAELLLLRRFRETRPEPKEGFLDPVKEGKANRPYR